MAEGHGRDVWSRAALLCALIGNAHRDPKKGRAFKVADFDPFSDGQRESGEVIHVDKQNIGTLKKAFLQREGRKGS
jgi:hypothetical protein